MIIFQISCVLAAFQKYYEFKNFVELLPYKKAIEKSKEGFQEMICTYRAELLKRRAPPNSFSINNKVNSVPQTTAKKSVPNAAANNGVSSLSQDELAKSSESRQVSKPFLLHKSWQVICFLSMMMAIFGAMLENQRLLLCGYYTLFELAYEMVDAGMSWMERR